jgi:hypothetical protein
MRFQPCGGGYRRRENLALGRNQAHFGEGGDDIGPGFPAGIRREQEWKTGGTQRGNGGSRPRNEFLPGVHGSVEVEQQTLDRWQWHVLSVRLTGFDLRLLDARRTFVRKGRAA